MTGKGIFPKKAFRISQRSVAEGGITLYIEVEDIDAILKAVVDKGGKVMKPKFAIPNVGHIALFTDPDGNRMGLWSK